MTRQPTPQKIDRNELPAGMVATVQQTLERIAASLDLQEILDVITANARALVGSEIAQVNLYDPETDRAWVGARDDGRPDRPDMPPTPPRPKGLTMQIVRQGAPVIVEDVMDHPRFAGYKPVQKWGIKTWAGFPIRRGKTVVGVLMVAFVKCHRFTRPEQNALELMVGQAAVAIENARLFEAEQERRRIAEALSRTASILTSTLDLGRVLELVLDNLRSVVDYDSCAIFLRQHDRLLFTAGRGFSPSVQIDNFSFLIAKSALESILTEEGHPMIIPDVLESDSFQRAEGHDTVRSWIGAPLWARGNLVGLMTVDHSEPGRYDEQDASKVMDFANQAAIVIENARLHAAVQVYAEELEIRVEERTAELRQEKEKTEAILNSVADGVVVAAPDGEIWLANPVAMRWLHLEVNGQKRSNRALSRFVAHLAQTSPADRVHRTEFYIGPSRVTLEAHAARLYDDNVARGIVVVLRDVTRQQELERLKSQFIASVSHELRTPLANVKLYLSLLRKGKEERRTRYLDVATQEAGRLEQLIQSLLDFSHLDAPTSEVHHQPVRLDEIVRQTLHDYRSEAECRGIALTVHLDSSVPLVLGDGQQLSRMLIKLLDNALSYTSTGGRITLALRCQTVRAGYCAQICGPGIEEARGLPSPTVPDGEWVSLVVQDTGVGILPQDLPHIFDRFYRGSHERTMRVPGTGLGLSHVQDTLRRHRGHIAVSSAVDEGSVFVVFLPGYGVEA